MSTSRLGRSEGLEKYWSEHLGDRPETDVAIKSIDREHVESFPEVADYPFDGQIKLTGTFTFEIPSRNNGSFTQTGEYEYRTASELFLIETSTDLVDAEDVFTDLNRQLASTAEIQRALSPPRDFFWRFIEEADTIETLILRGRGGTYDAAKLLSVLQYDDPVETLRTNPEFSDLRSIEDIEDIISSVDAPSEVDGIQDLNIDIYSTIIDEVKATYWFCDRAADVWYKRGVLQLDAESVDAREYVIQLFERDVVHGGV